MAPPLKSRSKIAVVTIEITGNEAAPKEPEATVDEADDAPELDFMGIFGAKAL